VAVPREVRPSLRSRSTLARYLFGVVATTAALLITVALSVTDEPIYALLIGAVALTAWYGGVGPSVVAIALGWAGAVWLLVDPRWSLSLRDAEDIRRWWINLAVVIAIAALSCVLRARQERTAAAISSAESAIRPIEALQRLSSALSVAVSSSDVAGVLTEHAAEVVGAQGVAFGLVEGEELEIVQPTGLAARGRPAGSRIPLASRTLLTGAATGSVARVDERARLETAYPDSASVLPTEVRGGVAAPVRTEGEVVGSLAFLFDRPHSVDDQTEAMAVMIADLAGQALERARLYEHERESRRALERIVEVAPRFLADTPVDTLEAICREARTTFGADFGVLWRISGDRIRLLRMDPAQPSLQVGGEWPLDDFPALRDGIRSLRVAFVPDVLEEAQGAGLELVQRLGIRSSLRTPIVIAGTAELVLAMSWHVVVSEPDGSTLAIVRRFADQAGLALEQIERRRAEADAARRADETRRLQEVTAALSLAATPAEVSDTCLDQALASIGADAGLIVLSRPGETTVEIVTSRGYGDDELGAWRGFGLEADVPFARAISGGEPVWALSAEDMAAFTGIAEAGAAGWITIPLRTSGGTLGALHITLRTPYELTPADRGWLLAMVSQCAQALERSRLYENERRSRMRSERLQSITAALSNALTRQDVAAAVVDEIGTEIDSAGIAVGVIDDEHQAIRALAWRGYGDDSVAPWPERPAEAPAPDVRAMLAARSRRFASTSAIAADLPGLAEGLDGFGHTWVLVVPLVAGRRVNGVIVASWEDRPRLSAEDLTFVDALAGQSAHALDRAGLFESEQTIAETFQRSVLPVSLPRLDGVRLAARYLPGSTQLDVGGDWFDALQLPDGKLGLVVGDVVGKGVHAAASMAQLRNALRAFSIDRLKPSSALARLNRLADDALETSFATIAYVVVDPRRSVCRLASAGHPPPVVSYPDGRVELLEGARGLPLGTGIETRYRHEVVELPAGSVLVLYTDGLVERRGRSIDEGLAELCSAVREAPKDPERLLEYVIERLVGTRERGDDIALLAARLLPVAPQPLRLRVPAQVASMDLVRDALRAWLEGVPVDRTGSEEIVLAAWEACANAVEHAVDPRDGMMTVRAALEDSVTQVVVEDSGAWAAPARTSDRGLGLRLMRALMSSVDITHVEGGTRVTLEKSVGSDGEPEGSPVRAARPEA
jgi:serine phosphatase RsbU (regulator of sigma subunit)/anti-sigma regulatory factor (Ser/Thr protein kinase)